MFASNATTLNGLPTNSVGPYGDAGNMYSGGWSSSGNDAADAGLIYSAARNVGDVFINVVSTGFGEITTNEFDFAPNYDDEIDFIIGCQLVNNTPSGCSQTPDSGSYLASFVWGQFTNGNFGGVTLVQTPSNMSDWEGSSTVVKAMVSIAQSNPPGGVAYDGYGFGYVAVDYCGWSGPTDNLCWDPPQQEPSYYHLEQYVPNQSVVQTSLGATAGYYEDIGITLTSSGTQPFSHVTGHPPCTLDSKGWCDVAGSLNRSGQTSCTYYVGGKPHTFNFYTTESQAFEVYNSTGVKYDDTERMSSNDACPPSYTTKWSPGEPKVQTGDSNLP